jgi:hypothetical protein
MSSYPFASQEERPHPKPTLWAPSSWTSSEKINVCSLVHSVCGISLGQSEQTNGWVEIFIFLSLDILHLGDALSFFKSRCFKKSTSGHKLCF